jgi:hypothetical protein
LAQHPRHGLHYALIGQQLASRAIAAGGLKQAVAVDVERRRVEGAGQLWPKGQRALDDTRKGGVVWRGRRLAGERRAEGAQAVVAAVDARRGRVVLGERQVRWRARAPGGGTVSPTAAADRTRRLGHRPLVGPPALHAASGWVAAHKE